MRCTALLLTMMLVVPMMPANAIAQEQVLPEVELERFVELVLAKLHVTWHDLYDYVFEESMVFEFRINGRLTPSDSKLLPSGRCDYVWLVRDGYLIRSPIMKFGRLLSEEERTESEREYLEALTSDDSAVEDMKLWQRVVRHHRDYPFRQVFHEGENFRFMGREVVNGRELVRIGFEARFIPRDSPIFDRRDDDRDPWPPVPGFLLVDPDTYETIEIGYDRSPPDVYKEFSFRMLMHSPYPGVQLPLNMTLQSGDREGQGDSAFAEVTYSNYRRTEVDAQVIFGRPAPIDRPSVVRHDRSRAFLGFEPGEERRYLLGPHEALNPDEYAKWRIRLDSVDGDPPVGTFTLAHERNDPAHWRDLPGLADILGIPNPLLIPRGLPADYRDPVHVNLEGEVRVNAQGFPMEATFGGIQRFSNRVHRFWVTYSFEEDGYLKEVESNGREWSITIPIGTGIELEERPVRGIHIYFPSDMHCLGRGSILHYLADLTAMTDQCDTPVLLFANPGLLGLALSKQWETGDDERRLWFLTPTGPLLHNAGSRGTRHDDFDPKSSYARDESHYFAQAGFELVGRRTIDVGSRRLSAWEVDVDGALERAYLDDHGRLLRIDLGPHPITSHPRWIRLLSPSEY